MDALDSALAQVRAQRQLPPPGRRRALRRRAGLSQAALAGVLRVSRPTIALYESGRRTPRAETAVRYIEVLRRLALEGPQGGAR